MKAPTLTLGLLLLVLLIAGCGRAPAPTLPDATSMPVVASATPPRAAVPTLEPTPEGEPTTIPDTTQLDATYASARGDLALRYPDAWALEDRSDSQQTLVTIQPPDGSTSAFIAHLESSGGPLPEDGLREFAAAYVETLFGGAVSPPIARQEGPRYILTALEERPTGTLQYELRFQTRASFVEVLTLVAPAARWDELAPTLDAIARSVAVAEAQLPLLPTPVAEEALQQEGLTVARHRAYQRHGGGWVVVGEVRNDAPSAYSAVTVSARLAGADGDALATLRWRTPLRLLPSGGVTPFALYFDPVDGQPADVTFDLGGIPAEEEAARYSQNIEADVQVDADPSVGVYALSGTLRNSGPPVEDVRVAAALYDGAGELLAVVSGALDIAQLATEESTPFSLTFYHAAEGEVTTHQLWVEGQVRE